MYKICSYYNCPDKNCYHKGAHKEIEGCGEICGKVEERPLACIPYTVENQEVKEEEINVIKLTGKVNINGEDLIEPAEVYVVSKEFVEAVKELLDIVNYKTCEYRSDRYDELINLIESELEED